MTTEANEVYATRRHRVSNSLRTVFTVLLLAGTAAGMLILPVIGGIFTSFDALREALLEVVLIGLLAGAVVGVLSGIVAAGLLATRHFVFRLLLWLTGAAPLRYSAFPEFAVDALLLRKIGNGYIFVHRNLLDYFARIEPPTHQYLWPIFKRPVTRYAASASHSPGLSWPGS